MSGRAERREAQGAVFNAQYPRIAGWAGRLVDDVDAGHDIAAETFVRLIARWPDSSDPSGYAWVIAANLVRDRWRRDSTRRRGLRLLRATHAAAVPASDNGIRDLVERLPEPLRVPVLLHYYADLSAEVVALHLCRPAGTVRRQLVEARSILRQALEAADA